MSPAARVTAKILFVAANPDGSALLRIEDEFTAIQEAIRAGTYRDDLDLELCLAADFGQLLAALDQHRPEVVHFSGHGTEDGSLMLERKDGAPAPMRPGTLGALLRAVPGARVVVLNACYTRAAATAVLSSVECAVGTSREILDVSAIDFSTSFYRAISYGRTVGEAFDHGLVAIRGGEGGGNYRELAPLIAPVDQPFEDESHVVLLLAPGVDPCASPLVGPNVDPPPLRSRMEGPGVRLLQIALNARGADPHLEVDGIFGGATLRAVLLFQADRGLAIDGVVGKNTRAALRKRPGG